MVFIFPQKQEIEDSAKLISWFREANLMNQNRTNFRVLLREAFRNLKSYTNRVNKNCFKHLKRTRPDAIFVDLYLYSL